MSSERRRFVQRASVAFTAAVVVVVSQIVAFLAAIVVQGRFLASLRSRAVVAVLRDVGFSLPLRILVDVRRRIVVRFGTARPVLEGFKME